MLRLSDHAIKMMEQRLRIEKQRTYQANKVVDNLHHKYFFQHIFQPKDKENVYLILKTQGVSYKDIPCVFIFFIKFSLHLSLL